MKMARKRQTETSKLDRITVVPLKNERQLEEMVFRNILSSMRKTHPNSLLKDDIIKYYKTKILPNSVAITAEKQGERFGFILYFRKGAKPNELSSVVNALRRGRTNTVIRFSAGFSPGKKPEVFRSFINQKIYNAFADTTTAVLNAIAMGELPTVAAVLTKMP